MGEGLFHEKGNRTLMDDVNALRLAKITSVNPDDMTVDIEILGESTGKTTVPIPMPMVSPGHGIFAIPTKGTIVVIGLRTMQFPLVIGYYPFNIATPDSYWQRTKQVFGMPEGLSEGDVYIRARSMFARCEVCQEESTVEAFESNINRDDLLERCPSCGAPSVEVDAEGEVRKVNKVQLGSTFHMGSDGKTTFQVDNMSSRERGQSTRLLKIVIDAVTGDITIQDAGNIIIGSLGDVSIKCKKFTLTADDAIEQSSNTRVINTTSEIVEEVESKAIEASDTLRFKGDGLILEGTTLMNVRAGSRTTAIEGDDNYNSGGLFATVSGDRIYKVTGDEKKDIKGGFTFDIKGKSVHTVDGASELTVKESYTVKVEGAKTETVTGDYKVSGGGIGDFDFVGAYTLDAPSIAFNGGVLEVARKTDPTLIDGATAAALFTYFTSLKAHITSLENALTSHTHASLGAPPTIAPPITTTNPTAPSSFAGKVDGGSATVKA